MATKKQIIEFAKNAVKHIENNEIPFVEQAIDKDNISFKDGVFKYMGISICRVLPDINGKLSVIASSNIIFPDALKYLKDIQGLVKVPVTRMYLIPQIPNSPHTFYDDEIKAVILSHLKNLSANLEGTVACKQFTRFYEQASALSLNVFPKWNLVKDEDFKSLTKEYKKIYKRVGEDKAKVAEWVDTHTFEEAVAVAYFNVPCPELADVVDFVDLMQKYMNPTGEQAFLKVIDGKICTPQVDANGNFTEIMSPQDGMNLTLKLLQGTLRHGQKFGKYTIMKNTADMVKISCNNYTPEMLKIIHAELKQARAEERNK